MVGSADELAAGVHSPGEGQNSSRRGHQAKNEAVRGSDPAADCFQELGGAQPQRHLLQRSARPQLVHSAAFYFGPHGQGHHCRLQHLQRQVSFDRLSRVFYLKKLCDCRREYLFNFDNKFEIHDDMEVLKRMGLALGLEKADCSEEDLVRARSLVPPSLESYVTRKWLVGIEPPKKK